MNLAAVRPLALPGAVVCLAVLSVCTTARAADDDDDVVDDLETPSASSGFSIDRRPGWSVGVDGYAGIATQSAGGRSVAHGLAGGLVRLRWTYIQIGATYERSDYSEDEWVAIGGFAGAFVPYSKWVDFEFAIGGASRKYTSHDPRYGGTYDFNTSALTLRAGVSDRAGDALFGPRVGLHLTAAIDLQDPSARWSYTTPGPSPVVFSGVTDVGGFSMGLILSVGIDVAVRPRHLAR